jgi:hypothetical protein
LTAGAVPARVVALTEGVIKTMFLLKLRTFVAVAVVALVGAGVVGLAYRTTAAEPGRTAGVPAVAGQAAADDLDSLRLEVEALRKGLQATRERVKSLEEEVKGLKAAPRAGVGDVRLEDLTTGRLILGTTTTSEGGLTGSINLNERNLDVNPLAEADAALKKLHANPDDKEAADALEKALQQLKQRKKPDGTATGTPAKP